MDKSNSERKRLTLRGLKILIERIFEVDNLTLIKSEQFGEIQCDFYGNKKDEVFMTREQIGSALEYTDPKVAITKIHSRHKDRLDQFSRGYQIGTPSGKQETIVYTRKGIMEICRWSQQPKADAFMDWVWDIMDSLMKGETKIIHMTEYQKLMTETRKGNVQIRKARELLKLSTKYTGKPFAQVLDSYATKELTGEYLIPLPEQSEKTYSATDIGKRLGISANMVGKIANKHNLKTTEYGGLFVDKSRYSNKEVETFRYYDTVMPVIAELVKGGAP